MPNHVTTRCTVTGPAADVAAFRTRCIVPVDGSDQFDFNAVIPMPEILRGTEDGTRAEEGAALLLAAGSRGAPYATLGLYDHQIAYIRGEAGLPRDASISDVARAFLEKHPDWREHGEKRLRAVVETGFVSWYSWSIDKWGTKWGAYSFAIDEEEPGRLAVKFDTAWSFPTPVFDALVEQYPTLTFDCLTFDEGSNFAGTGQFGAVVTEPFHLCAATDDLFEAVYGHPPEREEEEEGEGETVQ
jgi:hypothetical protein